MSGSTAEYWDMYDGERRPLGHTVMRGRLDPERGEYHVAVMIAVMNSRGKLLCTLRSPEKKSYPNEWELTAGSVLAGETSREAAVRELREETGISAAPEEPQLIGTVKESTAFIDCYFLRRDIPIEEIVLQEGETAAARWVGKAEFENMIARRRFAFPVVRRYSELRNRLLQEGFI